MDLRGSSWIRVDEVPEQVQYSSQFADSQSFAVDYFFVGGASRELLTTLARTVAKFVAS